jgi:hypothetical protein
MMKNNLQTFEVELNEHILVEQVMKPIYSKFLKQVAENELHFKFESNIENDIGVEIEKEGTSLILMTLLRNAFYTSK